MKVSEKWLREWVELDATTEEISHQLIMSGTELDGIDPVASAFTDVRVGQINSIEQHPDADRLRVCQVNIGSDQFFANRHECHDRIRTKSASSNDWSDLPSAKR